MIRADSRAADDLPVGAVRSLAVIWAINTLAYSIVHPFLPIYLHQERQFPLAQAALVFPVMGMGAIVGAPLAGWLADRVGHRRLLVGTPLLRGVVFAALAILAALNAPLWTFMVGLFVSSLLGAAFQNGSDAFVTRHVPAERRVAAFSIVRVGLNVGWMLGPALGAFMARTPFALLFMLTALLCVLASRMSARLATEDDAGLPSARTTATVSFAGAVLRDRQMLLLLAFSLLLFLSVSQFLSTLSVYVTGPGGLCKGQLGLLYSLNGGMVIAMLVAINARLKSRNLYLRIAAGAFLYVIAYGVFGGARSWGGFALGMTVLTLGEMLSVSTIATAASWRAAPGMAGRYMGLMGLVRNVGYAVGPYVGALLLERWGQRPQLLWGVLSSGALIAGVAFLLLAREAPRPRGPDR